MWSDGRICGFLGHQLLQNQTTNKEMRHAINVGCFLFVLGFIALAIWYKSMIWGICAVIMCTIWMFYFPNAGNDDENDVFHHPNRLNTP